MTRVAVVALLGTMLAGATTAVAQTSEQAAQPAQAAPSQAAPVPAQPAPPQPAPAQPATQPPRPFPEGSKFAFINTQRVAGESVEGRAATAKLKALNDKKVLELNERQKQLQAQQQKLAQGGSVMSDQARVELEKNIEKMNVDIQRFTQDAQAEVQEMNNQLQGDFERKLRPIIAAVSQEKGLHIVFGPESGIVWADAGLDITVDVIKRFDQAATPAPGAPK